MNEIQQEPLIQQGDLEQELEQQPTEPAMLSLPNSVGDAEHEALNESPDHVSPEEGNLEQLLKEVGNAEPEQHPDEHALVQEGGFCGGCGAPLQPAALFCNNCGQKKTWSVLSAKAEYNRQAGSEERRECVCHCHLSLQLLFCGGCGSRISNAFE
jgi:hypothetical protein